MKNQQMLYCSKNLEFLMNLSWYILLDQIDFINYIVFYRIIKISGSLLIPTYIIILVSAVVFKNKLFNMIHISKVINNIYFIYNTKKKTDNQM